MQTRQLSLDEVIMPEKKVESAAQAISGILNDQITFDPEKKICHGVPMRKVELSPGRFAWRCDECQTLMVQKGKD